jgi:hypothetical protein
MSKVIRIKGDGTYPLEVAGESFYQDNLIAICGPIPSEDPFPRELDDPNLYDNEDEPVPQKRANEPRLFDALLVPEPTNKHDKNAVKVIIQDKQVGYLPRPEAADYKKIFTLLKLPTDTTLAVSARIFGGYNAKKSNYGVWLDFCPTPAVANQLKAAAANKKSCCLLPMF